MIVTKISKLHCLCWEMFYVWCPHGKHYQVSLTPAVCQRQTKKKVAMQCMLWESDTSDSCAFTPSCHIWLSRVVCGWNDVQLRICSNVLSNVCLIDVEFNFWFTWLHLIAVNVSWFSRNWPVVVLKWSMRIQTNRPPEVKLYKPLWEHRLETVKAWWMNSPQVLMKQAFQISHSLRSELLTHYHKTKEINFIDCTSNLAFFVRIIACN